MNNYDLAEDVAHCLANAQREDLPILAGMVDIGKLAAAIDLKALAKQIVAEFPNLTHAAFTLRDGSTSSAQCFSGALYEAATDTLHTAPAYTITQVIDRLGAGDAFTAGLVFSFLQNSTAPAAITFATAAGCLAHSIEGDYNYSTREEIEAVMQGDGGGRVSR